MTGYEPIHEQSVHDWLYNESDDNPLRNVIEISRPFTSNDDCEEAIEQLKPHVHAYLDEYNRTLELIDSYDKEN